MPPFRLELWDEEPCNSLCFVKGPIIVGAGPSGLAMAACLKRLYKIPSLILERSESIASLWKHQTYDRIHLHLPKQFCDLPLYPIPPSCPVYLSGPQFLKYLQDYAEEFKIHPRFNEEVTSAKFDEKSGLWRVFTKGRKMETMNEIREYAGHWLIIASGENAEAMVPRIEGLQSFKGSVLHSSAYKNGRKYEGSKVLVVGCGNSGMEIALDLIHFKAKPSIVVRNTVHVLPQEILGKSTFLIIVNLLKIFPVWLADYVLLFCAWCKWKNTAKCGLPRPKEGPIAQKNSMRRTPVLDIGTLRLIKSGQIKVRPGIKCFTPQGAKFVDGHVEDFDAVVFATGYKSNVTKWLSDDSNHFTPEGLTRAPTELGWKGKRGLYTVGFSGMGLSGTSSDAQRVAEEINGDYYASNGGIWQTPS